MKRRNFVSRILGTAAIAAISPAALARDRVVEKVKKPYDSEHLPMNVFEKDLAGVLDYDGNLYIALFTSKREMTVSRYGSTDSELVYGASYDIETNYEGYSRVKVPRDLKNWDNKRDGDNITAINKKEITFAECNKGNFKIDVFAICPGPMAEPLIKGTLDYSFNLVGSIGMTPQFAPGDLEIEEPAHSPIFL